MMHRFWGDYTMDHICVDCFRRYPEWWRLRMNYRYKHAWRGLGPVGSGASDSPDCKTCLLPLFDNHDSDFSDFYLSGGLLPNPRFADDYVSPCDDDLPQSILGFGKIFSVAMLAFVLCFPLSSVRVQALELTDVPFIDFARRVSDLTGRDIVVADSVSARVTVFVPDDVTDLALLSLFDSVLRVNNLVSVLNIDRLEIYSSGLVPAAPGGSLVVSALLPYCCGLSAEVVLKLILPLLSHSGMAGVAADASSIYVTDMVSNVSRVQRLLADIHSFEVALRLLPLRNARADEVSVLLAGLYPDLSFMPSPLGVLVRSSRVVFLEIAEVLSVLDVSPLQVLIDVAVVEMSTMTANNLAVELALQGSTLGGFTFPSGILTSAVAAVTGAGALPVLPSASGVLAGVSGDFSFLIRALSSAGDVELLSSPSVVVLHGVEASLLVGQDVPFRKGRQSTDGGGVIENIERHDVGIGLTVQAFISQEVVNLIFTQVVSAVDPVGVDAAADLLVNTRSLSTQVVIAFNDVLVVGGLFSRQSSDTSSRVPGLSRIPILGRLFRSESTTAEDRSLLIFIKPSRQRLSKGRDLSLARLSQLRGRLLTMASVQALFPSYDGVRYE